AALLTLLATWGRMNALARMRSPPTSTTETRHGIQGKARPALCSAGWTRGRGENLAWPRAAHAGHVRAPGSTGEEQRGHATGALMPLLSHEARARARPSAGAEGERIPAQVAREPGHELEARLAGRAVAPRRGDLGDPEAERVSLDRQLEREL